MRMWPVVVMLGAVTAAGALAAISAEGARVVGQVNAAIDGFPKNEGYASGNFSGDAGAIRNHVQQAEQLAGQCNTALRMLIRDSREPEVVAATRKLQGFNNYIESVKKALTGAGQTSEQLNQMVFAFIKEYLQDGTASLAAPFLNNMLFPDSKASMGEDNARMKQLLDKLAVIDNGCKTKYKPIANAKHPYNDRNFDPDLWCRMAANRQQMAQDSVKNLAAGSFNVWISEINKMKANLERNEGFLQTDVTPIRKALWERDAMRREMAERYKGQFESVGLSDTSSLLSALDPAIDGLMAEVNRLAPQWKFPAGPRDAAIEAMARSQVARTYSGAAVRATVMQEAAFKINKNRLGIPLDRYKDGFVLYKVANEKLCRQQSFTYTEVFDASGGSGYQKPSGVRLNYIRYMNCQ